jgi:hypothetical protein
LDNNSYAHIQSWLVSGNAPVSPEALIREALARVRTDEGEAGARSLAARKPEYRDGACRDLEYPPYSVERGLLTWALRNLLHVVAAQYLGVYDAATMPDPTDAATLFAEIKQVHRALIQCQATATPDRRWQWQAAASPAVLMNRVLLETIVSLDYARIAKELLQDAGQWHPYPGPHLGEDEEDGVDAQTPTRPDPEESGS